MTRVLVHDRSIGRAKRKLARRRASQRRERQFSFGVKFCVCGGRAYIADRELPYHRCAFCGKPVEGTIRANWWRS